MKRSLILTALVLIVSVIAACSGSTASTNGADADGAAATDNGDIDAAKLYTQFCTQCHGADGKLGLAGAKDLTTSEMTREQKINIVTNGKGGMTPYKDMLSTKEIEAVVDYLDTRFGQQ